MVLRFYPLTNSTVNIVPTDLTFDQEPDDNGVLDLAVSSASGPVTSDTATPQADLSKLGVLGPYYACSGQWADETGTAKINFPAWVGNQIAGESYQSNPTPAGALLTGVLVIMDQNASPTFPTGIVLETPTPVQNSNGNIKAYAFHYVCQGNESGTKDGNNPTSISIPYEAAAGTSAVLLWEINVNAQVANFSMVSNPSSPAAGTHNVPTVATGAVPSGYQWPVVYAVVGRTASHVTMGAHSSDLTHTTERQSASNASSAKNNMGGVMYDEKMGAAASTPNRQATTSVNSFTVGMVWALKKVYT